MKPSFKIILALSALAVLTAPAFGWNCPSGQIRQQAPAGTPTNTPYYDVVEGIAFICVPSNPTPPSTPPGPSAAGSQNQTQTQNQQQSNSQNQSQNTSVNATQNTSNQNSSSSGSSSKSN